LVRLPVVYKAACREDLPHSRGERPDTVPFSFGLHPSLFKAEPDQIPFGAGNLRFDQRQPDIDGVSEEDPGKRRRNDSDDARFPDRDSRLFTG
jgi:hypothetical protein